MIQEFLVVVKSIRARNPDVPIEWVPYNRHTVAVEYFAPRLGVRKIETDYEEIDRFAAEFFEEARNNIRNIAALRGRRVAYIDLDCVVTSDMFSRLATLPKLPALVFGDTSSEWVYSGLAEVVHEFVRRSRRFSTGFFAVESGFPTMKEVMALPRANPTEFNFVRQKGVSAQPLLNYAVDKLSLSAVPIREIFPDLSGPAAAPDAELVITADGEASVAGRKCPFLHWPGPENKHRVASKEAIWKLSDRYLYEALVEVARPPTLWRRRPALPFWK